MMRTTRNKTTLLVTRRFYEKHRGSLLVQLPLFLLFWVCVYFIATSSGNAFLYSRF